MNYADMRSIEVRQYDNVPAAPSSNLDEVIIARISPLLVGSDELVEYAQQAAVRTVGSYYLDDKRQYTNWGASGATQEVIISVMQATAEPAVAGTVTALVEELISWAKKTRDETKERMTKTPGYSPPPPIEQADLAFTLSWVRHYVADRFGASEDALVVDAAQLIPGGAFIVLTDSERDRKYKVEVSENGDLMRFREIRPQKGGNPGNGSA